jgi:lysozyme
VEHSKSESPGKRSRNKLLLAALGCALSAGCGSEGDSTAGSTGFPHEVSQDVTVCAGGTVVYGVDVSVFQGAINWPAVKGAGKSFAIARISDGTYLDTKFSANWPAMKSAGLVRGAYQFFEPGEDPTTQANIVINAVGRLGAGDLPVTADMEVTGSQSAATIIANLQTWMAKVEAGTGKKPMIYTALGYWNAHVNSSAFSGNPLWAANWGVTCPGLANGWGAWKFWQNADNGSVGGIGGAVDTDEFNGSLADLQGFAGALPEYSASYVSQTWPLASTTISMRPDQEMTVSITLKNTGTATWDSNTKIGTTQPRDRSSPFATSGWLGPNRPAHVTGTVPPGGTFTFTWKWHAPADGNYDEFYGVVQEGAAWFTSPPENDIEAKFSVTGTTVNPPPVDAGMPDAGPPDAGHDAGPPDAGHDAGTDAGPPDAGHDAGTDAGVDAGNPDAGHDAGPDAGVDAGVPDAGHDAGVDAGMPDAGHDAGVDAGHDAGVDAGLNGDAGVHNADGGSGDGGLTLAPDAGGGCESVPGSTASMLALVGLFATRRRRRTALPR